MVKVKNNTRSEAKLVNSRESFELNTNKVMSIAIIKGWRLKFTKLIFLIITSKGLKKKF